MSAAHTPGPWYADKLEDCSAFNIFMPGYCSAGASVHHRENAIGCMSSREVEANARLIEASPDLLAALEAEQEWSDRAAAGALDPEWDYETMVGDKRRAAIVKAKRAGA